MSERPDIPAQWMWAKLETVCEVIMGQSPPSTTYNDNGVGLPFFQGKAEFTDLYPEVRKWCTTPTKLAECGDILLSVRAPVGPTNIAPTQCAIGRGLAAIRPLPPMSSRYVLYALRLLQSVLVSQATGSTFEAVSGDIVRSLRVPIAPSAEQERIVAAIEEQFTRLDAGVVALKRAQAALKRYRAAVLKAAVEGRLTAEWRAAHPNVEPASELLRRILAERRARWEADLRAKGKDPEKARYEEPQSPQTEGLPELPQGWVWATVDQVSHFTRYGTSAKTNDEQDGVPILRMGNIQEGALDVTSLKYLPTTHDEFPELLLQPGDLLFNRTNSAELVGKSAVYHGTPAPCSFASYLISVRFLPGCSSDYVGFALNSTHGREWVASVVVQQVGQANVNGSKLRAFHLPLPPQSEQDAIIASVEERISVITTLEATIAANLKRAERLRQAILERAFTGRLVPQDLADEPASALLERIHSERPSTTERGRRPIQHPAAVVQSVVPWDVE